MSKYVHSIYNGRASFSLERTEDEAYASLNRSLERHRAKGERAKDVVFGIRPAWEIWDRDGITIGMYWLDDEKSSRQPSEADGPRTLY